MSARSVVVVTVQREDAAQMALIAAEYVRRGGEQSACSAFFAHRLGSFQVNLDAALEGRNDPAISSKADPLDIGSFAHIRRGILGVTPLGRQGRQRDLAGLGSHVCSEHFLFALTEVLESRLIGLLKAYCTAKMPSSI